MCMTCSTRVFSHYQTDLPTYPPPLSAAYHFFAFRRLFSSLESFHPPEIDEKSRRGRDRVRGS